MKILYKIALAIFSIVVLVLSVVYLMVFFDITSINVVISWFEQILIDESIRLGAAIFSGICFILSLITIFGDSDSSKPSIKIQTESGNLEITDKALETIALITISNYVAISNAVAKIKIRKDGVIVDVICFVLPNTNITSLNDELKAKIKEKIESQTSATVQLVNVSVKDIKKIKDLKEE